MKKRLAFLWNKFCIISTCTLTAMAFFTTILSPAETISQNALWQILFVSLLCALSTFLYPWERRMGRAELYIRVGIHYLLINVIVLGFGSRFDWYQPSRLKSMLAMLLTIAVIFAVVSFFSWNRSAKDAQKMNERLEQYQDTRF